MVAVAGHQIGKALCDALGLPKYTKSFTLRVETNQIVSVECEYYVQDGMRMVEALAEFNLVRKPTVPAEPEQEQMNFDAWMRLRTEVEHARYQSRMKVLSAGDAVEAQQITVSRFNHIASALRQLAGQ